MRAYPHRLRQHSNYLSSRLTWIQIAAGHPAWSIRTNHGLHVHQMPHTRKVGLCSASDKASSQQRKPERQAQEKNCCINISIYNYTYVIYKIYECGKGFNLDQSGFACPVGGHGIHFLQSLAAKKHSSAHHQWGSKGKGRPKTIAETSGQLGQAGTQL